MSQPAFQRDSWEEKKAQEEMEEARVSLQHIINAIADPIFVKDRQHRFVLLNDACCRLIGRKREDLLGKTDYDVFPIKEADVFREKDERVFLSGCGNVNEEVITDVHGTRHLITTKKELYRDHEGQPYIVGVIRDMTEHKRAQEKLRELNATLEARVRDRTAAYDKQTKELARSNAELERFASVASHDLQEPLRMVTSYVQLLARRYKGKLDKDADEFIGFVVDGVARMKRLISDLLEYSRLGRKMQPFKPTPVETVLKEVLSTFKVTIQETGAAVTWASLPVISADALGLAQVFQNLIGNALKFRAEKAPRIHIAAQKVEGLWVFSVSDNGIGIAYEHRERIFDVFQRLHSPDQYPGTGIGLAICKKIIEQHGGRIWVEGAPGEGSTFYFTLPGSQEEAA